MIATPETPSREPAEAPALGVTQLSVHRSGTPIVRGVSVELQRGEIVGVLGPSGAGKSTLFAALAGELPLAAGDVALGPRSLRGLRTDERARAGLSYLPQGASVLHDLSARENLATVASLVLGRRRAAEIDVDAALARVKLTDRSAVRARDLSGGERRRLELARATLFAPRVLLADEPFGGMDPHSVKEVVELLRALSRDGLAVLVSDHRAHEVLSLASRAILLVDGQVCFAAPSREFAENPLVSSRYLTAQVRGDGVV